MFNKSKKNEEDVSAVEYFARRFKRTYKVFTTIVGWLIAIFIVIVLLSLI